MHAVRLYGWYLRSRPVPAKVGSCGVDKTSKAMSPWSPVVELGARMSAPASAHHPAWSCQACSISRISVTPAVAGIAIGWYVLPLSHTSVPANAALPETGSGSGQVVLHKEVVELRYSMLLCNVAPPSYAIPQVSRSQDFTVLGSLDASDAYE